MESINRETKNGFYTFHDIIPEIQKLRQTTFITEQNVPAEIEFEENEDRYIHCGYFSNGFLIATARLKISNDSAKMGRVAVGNEFRNRGFGRKIVMYAEKEAKRLGAKSVYIDAQIQAKGFYEKLGYLPLGEQFTEADIPHIKMYKTV